MSLLSLPKFKSRRSLVKSARIPKRLPGLMAVALISVFALTGCPKDEYDPQTWIDKLDDPAEAGEAVRRLSELADPVAIKSLAEKWNGKLNKNSKVLRVIVALADQPDKEGGPFWDDALPVLRTAVADFEVGNQGSIDDAVFAAEALGRAKDNESISVLMTAASKKVGKLSSANRVRLAAIKALGSFGDNDRTVGALIKILNTPLKEQPINLNGAAIIALGNTRSAKAVEPLLKAGFEIPPLFQQVSLALAKIGKPAVAPTVRLLKGEHKELNEYAKKNGFNVDCSKPGSPQCKGPGALEFKAAVLLGDLRAKAGVDELIAGLGKKAKTSYFDPRSQAPGPSTHAAFIDALVKIGDPKAGPALEKFMRASSTDDQIRHAVIERYSQIARGTDSLAWLGKLIKDEQGEEQIRKAAAMAYGRLVQKEEQLAPLQFMVDRYKKAADERTAEAAKATEKDAKAGLERDARAYIGFANLFEQHIARAKPGIKCGDNAACYSELSRKDPDTLIRELGITITGKVTKSGKANMATAVKERSLLELSKLADSAADQLPSVLKALAVNDRIVREASLRFLQRSKDCKGCVARLDEIIEKQKDQSALTQLTHDTRLVREYLARSAKK